jgi:hypothetical protein
MSKRIIMQNKQTFRSILSLSFCAFIFSGCQKLDAGEFAVKFRALPTIVGGGVSNKVYHPGEVTIVLPWEKLYKFSGTAQTISYGGEKEEPVQTRSKDGNEVGLSMKVRFRIEPEKLPAIIQSVGTSLDQVREIVNAVSRADIRTHMNALRTRDFFSPDKAREAVERLKLALETRLHPEGIIIEDVFFDSYQFERQLPDGTTDQRYQEQIDQTQTVTQETEQERKRINTVIEQKRQEFNEAQAKVNRLIEQADGAKRQAVLRGDSYLESKKNEAQQIAALGEAEVQGLKQEIDSLEGEGGKALLRLKLAQELIAKNPKFISVQSGDKSNTGIEVQRTDTNELIKQLGLNESLKETKK